jgi:hypothetical protein
MLASQEAAAQNTQPGRIVGHIDGKLIKLSYMPQAVCEIRISPLAPDFPIRLAILVAARRRA